MFGGKEPLASSILALVARVVHLQLSDNDVHTVVHYRNVRLGLRAALPGGIAAGLAGDLEGKCVEVDWDILRRLSASRFLSFPETLPTRHPRQRQSSVVQVNLGCSRMESAHRMRTPALLLISIPLRG